MALVWLYHEGKENTIDGLDWGMSGGYMDYSTGPRGWNKSVWVLAVAFRGLKLLLS